MRRHHHEAIEAAQVLLCARDGFAGVRHVPVPLPASRAGATAARRRAVLAPMQTPDIARTATVHWEGDIARGKGKIDAESGTVSATYSFNTRFSNEPGTNPEELLAASHAACFTMALTLGLSRAGHAPAELGGSRLHGATMPAAGFSQVKLPDQQSAALGRNPARREARDVAPSRAARVRRC